MLASVGMVFALNDAGLLKWLSSILPSVRQTAIQSPADNPDASAFYLLLKNDAESRGRGTDLANPPAGPNGSDSSADIPPSAPESGTSQRSEARDAADAPPQALAPVPLRTNPPPDKTPVASPPLPGVAGEGPPESAVTPLPQPEPPIGPGPKAAGDAAPGAQGALTPPPADESSGVAEVPISNPAVLTNVPLPPIRPASLGKPAKHDKRAKAHPPAEAASESPAPPKALDRPASFGNPFLRLFGGASR